MTISTGVVYALMTLLAVDMTITAYKGARDGHLRMYRRLRWRHFVWAIVLLQVVTATYLALAINVPGMTWSWLNLLSTSGGNIYLMPMTGTPWMAVPFFVVLLLALPVVVTIEERLFRGGTRGWRDAAWRSVLFGLCHAIVGVQIGACLAIIWCGLFYSWCYLRATLAEAMLQHLAYNVSLFAIVMGAVLVRAV